jgi:hypothetical protein
MRIVTVARSEIRTTNVVPRRRFGPVVRTTRRVMRAERIFGAVLSALPPGVVGPPPPRLSAGGVGALGSRRTQRARPGRKVGKRCVTPTRSNRRRRSCTRYVSAGRALTKASLKAGTRRIAFGGSLGRRRLASGRYRAVIVATDRAGNRSKAKVLRFRAVKR